MENTQHRHPRSLGNWRGCPYYVWYSPYTLMSLSCMRTKQLNKRLVIRLYLRSRIRMTFKSRWWDIVQGFRIKLYLRSVCYCHMKFLIQLLHMHLCGQSSVYSTVILRKINTIYYNRYILCFTLILTTIITCTIITYYVTTQIFHLFSVSYMYIINDLF